MPFLGATKHLHNWLCLLVGWLVGWSVGRVTHSLDDPHVVPYWPTWPCSFMNAFLSLAKRLIRGYVHWSKATLREPISLRGSVDWLQGCVSFPSHPHNSPLPPTKLSLPNRITASAHSKRFRIDHVSVLVFVLCRCPTYAYVQSTPLPFHE